MHGLVRLREVEVQQVIAQVLRHRVQVSLHHGRVCAKQRRLQKSQVSLNVCDVVLLWKNVNRTAKRCGDVLAYRINIVLTRLRLQHIFWAELQIAQEHFLNLARVVHLRQDRCTLLHRCDLGKTLSLAKNCRVADGNDVHWTVEILRMHIQASGIGFDVLIGKVCRVDAVQDFENPLHRVVQTRVDRAEHHHALLDQCQRCSDRLIGVGVAEFFKRGLHHAFACVHQEAEQLEQRRRRAVEWNRHGQLANVVDQRAALDLAHLGWLQVERLPTRSAFELEQRWDVLDVGRVQQRTQSARGCTGQAANHVRQANRVSAAPWHKRELDNPLQLAAAIVFGLPVSVQAQRFARGLVDADDVRLHAVANVHVCVNLKDRAQTVFVVAGVLAALDFVVGDRCLAELDLIR